MSYRKKHYPPKPEKAKSEVVNTAEYHNPGTMRELSTARITSGLPYQRDVKPQEVERLLREWDARLLEPLVVSFRDGKYNLIDGQHRLTILRRMNNGKDVMVPCIIYDGLTYEQEAELCYKLDKSKTRMSLSQSTNALIESQIDPATQQINMLLESYGFKWALGKSKGNRYEITAARAVLNAYKLLGSDLFARMLGLLRDTWEGDSASLSAAMFSGLSLFLKTYETELNDDTFSKRLAAVSPEEIISRSKADFSTNRVSLRVAKVILAKFNKERGRKLVYRFEG